MSLVYSTDKGRLCPQCQLAVAQCECKTTGKNKAALSNKGIADGIVRLHRQTGGRGGKTVTLITGLAIDHAALQQLAKTLKQRCGSGGAIKNGDIEIQGDHREQLKSELEQRGFTVKIAGG